MKYEWGPSMSMVNLTYKIPFPFITIFLNEREQGFATHVERLNPYPKAIIQYGNACFHRPASTPHFIFPRKGTTYLLRIITPS